MLVFQSPTWAFLVPFHTFLCILLYSVVLWPLLDEAAPDYRVLCGSGLYSSRSSSCTGKNWQDDWYSRHDSLSEIPSCQSQACEVSSNQPYT